MKKIKITLFGVKKTTQMIAEYLCSKGIKIDLIVSIDPVVCQQHDIADYVDLAETARKIHADYYTTNDYSLKTEVDFFQNKAFELGIVYGWQRLIPPAILHQFSAGVFGFHASPEKLPAGRGRSPMNWALILGKEVLYNHCFKYSNEADAGDIHSIYQFSITPHDTILTLLYKSLVTAKSQLLQLIEDVQAQQLQLTPQQGNAYFFPKRTPQEGIIFFKTSSTKQIVNLVRGVTRPFSGAFAFTQRGKKVLIWEAWEFDALIDFNAYETGQVIDTTYHMPIIKTIDGSLIIKEYEGDKLLPGDILN